MQVFQTGQKSKLDALTPQTKLTLSVRVVGPAQEYDLTLFGLDAQNRLSDDRYMIFFNQPQSPKGSLTMQSGTRGEKIFQIDLDSLPGSIRRLTLASTVQDGTFAAIDHAEITLIANGQPIVGYRVTGRDFHQQRAIMLFDIYFKDVWRVGAVGQGFNGGLQALVEHYGGQMEKVTEAKARAAQEAKAAHNTGAAASASTAAPSGNAESSQTATPVTSSQKITLEKQGQSTKLSLSKDNNHPIHINLNWDRSLGFRRAEADLDLGCMYVMNDGSQGVIQALGNKYGSLRFAPYIELDKDDRTGESDDGENLLIARPDLIHTVLVFAFIYEGTSDFTRVGGELTLTDPRGSQVMVRLSNPDMQRTFCAIALIENYGGNIKITKEERYFTDHADCDQHYGFGFRWSAGSK